MGCAPVHSPEPVLGSTRPTEPRNEVTLTGAMEGLACRWGSHRGPHPTTDELAAPSVLLIKPTLVLLTSLAWRGGATGHQHYSDKPGEQQAHSRSMPFIKPNTYPITQASCRGSWNIWNKFRGGLEGGGS